MWISIISEYAFISLFSLTDILKFYTVNLYCIAFGTRVALSLVIVNAR